MRTITSQGRARYNYSYLPFFAFRAGYLRLCYRPLPYVFPHIARHPYTRFFEENAGVKVPEPR